MSGDSSGGDPGDPDGGREAGGVDAALSSISKRSWPEAGGDGNPSFGGEYVRGQRRETAGDPQAFRALGPCRRGRSSPGGSAVSPRSRGWLTAAPALRAPARRGRHRRDQRPYNSAIHDFALLALHDTPSTGRRTPPGRCQPGRSPPLTNRLGRPARAGRVSIDASRLRFHATRDMRLATHGARRRAGPFASGGSATDVRHRPARSGRPIAGD